MDVYHGFILSQRALLPSFIFEARMGHSKVNLFHACNPCFDTDCDFHILEKQQS
jgi:hypothetical protein